MKKNVLIDTVDHKFSREFVQNLRGMKSTSHGYGLRNALTMPREDHAGAPGDRTDGADTDTPITVP